MKKYIQHSLILACLALIPLAGKAQIILNNSFEANVGDVAGNFFYGDPDNWTSGGARGVTIGGGGSFGAPTAIQGSQVAFMQQSVNVGSEVSLFQAITFSSAGLYELSFWGANRGAANFAYEVDLPVGGLGSTVSGLLTSTSFVQQAFTFNVSAAGTYGFQIRDNSTSIIAADAFFDDFQINPVPEPETYALLALGLMALVFVKRFRVKQS
jgi:hypothetical protein